MQPFPSSCLFIQYSSLFIYYVHFVNLYDFSSHFILLSRSPIEIIDRKSSIKNYAFGFWFYIEKIKIKNCWLSMLINWLPLFDEAIEYYLWNNQLYFGRCQNILIETNAFHRTLEGTKKKQQNIFCVLFFSYGQWQLIHCSLNQDCNPIVSNNFRW